MSDEIAQDDDGTFEIGDIGVPGDSDDEDEEAQVGKKDYHQPAVNGVTTGGPSQAGYQQPSTSRNFTRDSTDGETLFAVGEDGDKFSDDGSDEDAKLVHGR